MAELRAFRDTLRPLRQALNVEDVCSVVPAIATRPSATAMFGKIAMELLIAAVFGISEAIDCLVAHADRVALQPHPASNLFG